MGPTELIDNALEKLSEQVEARGIERAMLTVSIADLLIQAKRMISGEEKNQNGSNK